MELDKSEIFNAYSTKISKIVESHKDEFEKAESIYSSKQISGIVAVELSKIYIKQFEIRLELFLETIFEFIEEEKEIAFELKAEIEEWVRNHANGDKKHREDEYNSLLHRHGLIRLGIGGPQLNNFGTKLNEVITAKAYDLKLRIKKHNKNANRLRTENRFVKKYDKEIAIVLTIISFFIGRWVGSNNEIINVKVVLTLSQNEILQGDSVKIEWSAFNVDSVVIGNRIGKVPVQSSMYVHPKKSLNLLFYYYVNGERFNLEKQITVKDSSENTL